MDKAEIQKIIARRLLKRYARQYKEDPLYAWNTIRAAVSVATVPEKKEIIGLLENASIVRSAVRSDALTEAEGLLADDTLTLEELSRIIEDN